MKFYKYLALKFEQENWLKNPEFSLLTCQVLNSYIILLLVGIKTKKASS